jgi:hypothetical protein
MFAHVLSRTRHLETCFQGPTKGPHSKVFSRTQGHPIARHLHLEVTVMQQKAEATMAVDGFV